MNDIIVIDITIMSKFTNFNEYNDVGFLLIPYPLDSIASASYNRKTSNLTSCIQYIFIGGPNSEFLRKLFEIDLDKILLLLRKYKFNKDYLTYVHLLKLLNMN